MREKRTAPPTPAATAILLPPSFPPPPSFPRKRESTPRPFRNSALTGVLDSGLRRNDGGGTWRFSPGLAVGGVSPSPNPLPLGEGFFAWRRWGLRHSRPAAAPATAVPGLPGGCRGRFWPGIRRRPARGRSSAARVRPFRRHRRCGRSRRTARRLPGFPPPGWPAG